MLVRPTGLLGTPALRRSSGEREAPPASPSSSTQIGVDQWVAHADERIERPTGLGGRLGYFWGRLPAGRQARAPDPGDPGAVLPFISEANLFNYGIFILIYSLLALGLNVVVGFAGLLDLGYVAFFGFGAYTYAFLSGTHSDKGHVFTHHWDAQWSIPRACSSAPCSASSSARRRGACSATTSRS